MAVVCLSVAASASLPRISSTDTRTSISVRRTIRLLKPYRRNQSINPTGRRLTSRRLNAGLSEVEPDLREEPIDQWGTPGIDPEDFEYGIYDGHHTYFEGEEDNQGTFWGAIADDIKAVEPPSGFQGFLSWLFLPAIAAGMYLNVPGEFLFGGAAIFATIFVVIEMDKPDKPHNFEPQIYNMERGARDKLINDYNTMSIWEFNDKYGELWDFTIQRDDITKRV
ncbi:unnamed protein product [Linum tenue]|uniref:NAD(P)H dehydrogenase 18 n=1 Tax=Linum tenue TaxID=586396 RepID=A0AAV0RRY6_9ROSI|nr:unnamed protein product [Linum tenue]